MLIDGVTKADVNVTRLRSAQTTALVVDSIVDRFHGHVTYVLDDRTATDELARLVYDKREEETNSVEEEATYINTIRSA